MRVAVLGAGIQGACAALELARRGCRVDLYEREALPVSRASRWNEGKLHLGLIYANDAPSRTARRVMTGSLAFRAGLQRWGIECADTLSQPFVYAVHRHSQLNPAQIEAHFAAVDRAYRQHWEAGGAPYFDAPCGPLYRRCANGEVDARFDAAEVAAAFETVERSVDPAVIALRLREALAGEPAIRLLTGVAVQRVASAAGGRLRVCTWDGPGDGDDYDHVVNALWEERLRIDATLGIHPGRPWLHRYKLALHVDRAGSAASLASVTLMLGPFGDIVNFGGGRLYLSWYPACRIGASTALVPPVWDSALSPARKQEVLRQTLAELARIVPAIGALDLAGGDVAIDGGYVFGWGETDIGDPRSELHQRFDIGVHSHGVYHSIDTGKYCMAPLFALEVGRRIVP